MGQAQHVDVADKAGGAVACMARCGLGAVKHFVGQTQCDGLVLVEGGNLGRGCAGVRGHVRLTFC